MLSFPLTSLNVNGKTFLHKCCHFIVDSVLNIFNSLCYRDLLNGIKNQKKAKWAVEKVDGVCATTTGHFKSRK